MKEIQRLQQLAGIITEIKVNKPINYKEIYKDCWEQAIDELGEYDEDFQDYIYNEDEVESYANEEFRRRTGKNYSDINEDISDFNIGQSSEHGGRRTTVTDIDPETQSVTWSVKKEIDDKDVHKDLTNLINKFEKVQLKDFHSRPKLIQLVKDLKSIRNKFSRTVVKEDRSKLMEVLKGVLNEIKVNNPNKPIYYRDEEGYPYIEGEKGKIIYGFDEGDGITWDAGEVEDYFGNYGKPEGKYILTQKEDLKFK